jgi:hypothetical protein
VPATVTGKGARVSGCGHNGSVKFRTGTAIAFVAGYALGAKAGRERYAQIARLAGGVGRSAPVAGTAALVGSKSKAVVTLGVERIKDTIGVRLGWRDGDQAADAIALDLAEDLAVALNSRRRSDLPGRRRTDLDPVRPQASSR